jgi:quercetin 2,3-dioxygenase
MTNRTLANVINPPPIHWVGDAFRVRGYIPQKINWDRISPFVMCDYAPSKCFEPSNVQRGVGSHPHRGFETVTIAYQGEIEHHDSRSNHGVIGQGEVQWMTAGSGILHKEYFSKKFAEQGGDLQMVQLWVNLPSDHKMTEPRYQSITKDKIATLDLSDSAGKVDIIAGSLNEVVGPAETFTPINLWNIYLEAGAEQVFKIPKPHNCAMIIIEGEMVIDGVNIIQDQMVLMSNDGQNVGIKAVSKSIILLMSGEPIDESIEAYGPFLMNTKAQILEAIDDFNSGKFGVLE